VSEYVQSMYVDERPVFSLPRSLRWYLISTDTLKKPPVIIPKQFYRQSTRTTPNIYSVFVVIFLACTLQKHFWLY